MSLIIKKNTTFKIPRVRPFYTPSLSMWGPAGPWGPADTFPSFCYGGGWRVHFDPRDVGKNIDVKIQSSFDRGLSVGYESYPPTPIPITFDIENPFGTMSNDGILVRLVSNQDPNQITEWSNFESFSFYDCN
jgi:hypothetical protein